MNTLDVGPCRGLRPLWRDLERGPSKGLEAAPGASQSLIPFISLRYSFRAFIGRDEEGIPAARIVKLFEVN